MVPNNASKQGTTRATAHKWEDRLRHPCRHRGPRSLREGRKSSSGPSVGELATSRLGDLQRFRGGNKICRGPQVKALPTSRLPCGEFPTLKLGEKLNSGPQVGEMAMPPLPYGGSPPLHNGETNLAVPQKWADWLHHPCQLGGPQRFKAWDKVSAGPQVGRLATSPMPSGWPLTL